MQGSAPLPSTSDFPDFNSMAGANLGVADSWWRKFLTERSRCQFRDPAGRQCRSERAPGDPTYCIRHARARAEGEQARQDSESGGGLGPALECSWEDLLGPLRNLRSAIAVNFVLGRVLVLKGAGLISSRDAVTYTYICQLLAQTLPQLKSEMEAAKSPGPEFDQLRRDLAATASLISASDQDADTERVRESKCSPPSPAKQEPRD